MFQSAEGQIGLVVFGLLAAGLVKGATGLGYSTTALPLMTLAMGLEKAMPLVLLPSISSNLFVMLDAGHFRESLGRFWPLYLAAIPGLAAGLTALFFIDKTISTGVLGGVLLVYSSYAMAKPGIVLPPQAERVLLVPVGLINGFLNGLTGSQIMPVVPFFLSLPVTSSQMVQGMNIAFTMSSLVMIAGLAWIGYLDWHALALSGIGIILAYVGVRVGTLMRRRIDVETFRRLVLTLLFFLGVTLVVPLGM